MRMVRHLLWAVPVALAAGCGLWSGPSGPPAKPGAKLPVDLLEARYDTLETVLQENKGSVVLVDFWATWCGPCVQSFPHVVELHKKYADKGLTVVSVSLDKPESREQVLEFLKTHDATFPNFIIAKLTRPEIEDFLKRFGDLSMIPHQVMFDKAGNKVWVNKEDPQSDAGLAKLIEKELVK